MLQPIWVTGEVRDLPFFYSEDGPDTEMGPLAPSAVGDEARMFPVIARAIPWWVPLWSTLLRGINPQSIVYI